MSVAIDFGTISSGIAYSFSRAVQGEAQQILSWPGSSENHRKVPTCLAYDEYDNVVAWGLEAKNASPRMVQMKYEWYARGRGVHLI